MSAGCAGRRRCTSGSCRRVGDLDQVARRRVAVVDVARGDDAVPMRSRRRGRTSPTAPTRRRAHRCRGTVLPLRSVMAMRPSMRSRWYLVPVLSVRRTPSGCRCRRRRRSCRGRSPAAHQDAVLGRLERGGGAGLGREAGGGDGRDQRRSLVGWNGIARRGRRAR